jgi:YcaO-like protein with predicted kinase domain
MTNHRKQLLLRLATELSSQVFEQTRREAVRVTRARLRPHLYQYGITRVSNVTGLDRLGLPVCMAIRPNAQSLSVSQGKGISEDAAWVSAVMEAIELSYAECPDLPLFMSSQRDMALRGCVLDVTQVPRRLAAPCGLERRMLWTQGIEMFTGNPIYVPYALVHVNAVYPFPPGDECFFVTSNGLASGTAQPEAVVHALCEVIERDAVSRWQRASAEVRETRWINWETADEPVVVALLELCERAQFDVLAGDANSPIGLPVMICVLLDRCEPPDTLRAAAMGFGCHLRRDLAFVRALTEAAQSRLTLIAGSRDDLNRSDYESRRRHRDGIEAYKRLGARPHVLDFRAVPDYPGIHYDDQVGLLLQRLSEAGIVQVALVNLSSTTGGLEVVRVIAPGMLGPAHAH